MTEDLRPHGARASRRAKGELARAGDVRFGAGQSLLVGLFIGWASIALKAGLNEVLSEETGYILLMAAAVLAAWFGGFIGGATATIVAVALNAIVFSAPDDPIGRVDQVRQILYIIVAGGTVALVASRRMSRDRLIDALDEVAELAEEVETRDARLEFMLSASGTGFWEWDVTTGALSWSDAIFEQHGLEPGGTPPDFGAYLEMLHPDDRVAFQEAIRDAIDGRKVFGLEFRVVWPDGTVHWTHGAGRVFRDEEGRPVRMIGTGQDITDRRRLEEERDALLADERRAAEFREAFVDVISHELRTPITTIFGLTQILARPGRSDDPAGRAAMLEDVRAESERLYRLVEDLLILSRVERGRLDIDAEPLQLRRLLERIVAQESKRLHSIRLRLEVGRDLPVVVGEATYVEQILRNLLGNAAKYTPPGTSVVVSAGVEGSDVAIRVRDEGPGIPAASRSRLFELFYRDPVSSRSVAGSGIGLFVCASLAEAMGGRIWVGDTPGGGAEFGFTMRTIAPDSVDQPEREGGATTAAEAPVIPGPGPGG